MSPTHTPAAVARAIQHALHRHGTDGLPAVAIHARGRPELLRRALRSLEHQSLTPVEVLVLDSTPSGDDAYVPVVAEFPRVRHVRVPGCSLEAARNRALAETSSAVLAFIDEDAVADRDWMLHLLRVFEDDMVAACTGRTGPPGPAAADVVRAETRCPSIPVDRRIELPGGRPRRPRVRAPLIAWTVSVGAGNTLAVRRTAARAVGGFDDRIGLRSRAGGDHDLLWRLLESGRKVVYEPAALAWRDPRPMNADAAREIASRQRGVVEFLVKSLTRAPLRRAPQIAAFLAWRLVEPGTRLVRRAAGRDPLPARTILAVWAASWRGLLDYAGARSHGSAGPAGI